MNIYSFLFFLCGSALLPYVAASRPPADFYIPPATVSAMQKTEQTPELKPRPQNYNRGAVPVATKQQLPQPTRNTVPKQPKPTAQQTTQSQTARTAQPAVVNYKKTRPSRKFREAPVEAILAKQPLSQKQLEHYKKNIIRSFTLLPKDLHDILQKELREINAETERMQQIKTGWKQQPSAYKFVNYQLRPQINKGISRSRDIYRRRKQAFDNLLKNAPADKYISVIESTEPYLYMLYDVMQATRNKSPNIKYAAMKFIRQAEPPSESIFSNEPTSDYYISIFDHEYNNIFSYQRQHVDSNQNRRILAAPSGNKEVDNNYQKLFDDYRADLRRIGYGLDITNPNLLRQIGEMKNQVITLEY